MKRYKVTVNGQSFDVAVEEVGGAVSAAPAVAVMPAAVATPAPAAGISPAPAPVAPQAAGVAGATTVKAPMPGTVLSYKVSVGQQVGRGDVLLILEAMKMENEIVATQAGTVVALRTNSGASVNTGDPLVDLV